jgi:hypothetical protein
LDPEELWHVLQTLTACRQIKNFFSERQDRYVRLNEIALGLGSFKELEKKMALAIAPGGEVLDRASERLFSIRRRLAAAQLRIKDRLAEIIRSTSYQKYLQDPIVTMREGRYVVPVKQEYRSHVPGIVHDQSASGATVFIEPMPVVEANNEVRGLMVEEKQEITRILTELSNAVGGQAEDGTLESFRKNNPKAFDKVKKQVEMNLSETFYPTKPLVPFIRATQDRVVLEIQRGCIRGCRTDTASSISSSSGAARCRITSSPILIS